MSNGLRLECEIANQIHEKEHGHNFFHSQSRCPKEKKID